MSENNNNNNQDLVDSVEAAVILQRADFNLGVVINQRNEPTVGLQVMGELELRPGVLVPIPPMVIPLPEAVITALHEEQLAVDAGERADNVAALVTRAQQEEATDEQED